MALGPDELSVNGSCCHFQCGSPAAHSDCLLHCLHSVLCQLMLGPQDFSIISIQCPLMTHHSGKGHLSLCKEKLPLWEVLLNGCGLQETPGAETWPLTHAELSPIWLRLTQELPTSLELNAVFLAQTTGCSLWTPGCRITHSLILLWHLPESRKTALQFLFLTQFFPASFTG